jgi:hypothetical protein
MAIGEMPGSITAATTRGLVGQPCIVVLVPTPNTTGFARGPRQRLEYARHSLCRAHFAHFYPAKTFPCTLGKGNARHSSLPCVICDARQRKVLTTVGGETALHRLYRAPLSTHGDGGTLCLAPCGSAHGKEWSRRMVDLALCRASSGAAHGKGWSMAHGGLRPLPCIVPLGARQRLV